ncbi:MAG: 3-dehydroquinate synthase [Syntrophorhabdales bacterium]
MIKLRSSIRDYYVHFEETGEFVGSFSSIPQHCYAVDKNVWRLHSDTLLKTIDPENILLLHAEEERKSLDTVLQVYNYLIQRSAKRNMTLISIGGGIIQDITGFACSTLYRGINWIFVPTTLLAQADSCIGSKTSLNYLHHKNLVGSFYPPSHVHIHTPFLATLESDYFFSGMGEVVKLAIVGGESTMREMVDLLPAALKRTAETLAACVHRSLAIKQAYIADDEFDTGRRNMLNFGHCFGHALESTSNFLIPHGQAVVIGVILANIVARERGLLSNNLCTFMLEKLLLPSLAVRPKSADLDPGAVIAGMQKDKKRVGGGLVLIMAKDRCEMVKVTDLEPAEVSRALAETGELLGVA